jgi:limonene-1,2-epoxide hydrolase
MSEAQQQPLAVLIAFLDAMRRGDLAAINHLLDPDVVWRGVAADAMCHNRNDVLDMLSEQTAEGLVNASALELVVGDGAVVLGVRSEELDQIGDEPLPGQLFNVFRVNDGRIVAVRDYANRHEALHTAAAPPPRWA